MSVEIGIVLSPPTPSPISPTGSRMVLVQIQPDGRVVDARVAHLGQGLARGAFLPPAVGDEVLVLCPGGDPNRAVVLGGLGNGRSPTPLAADDLHVLLQHPLGVELRSVDGLPAHGIVLGTLLVDLSAYLTALEAFIFACSTATTAPQVAAAAVALMAAIAKVGPAPSTFASQLAASAASGTPPGVGGLPYATATHKATT